MAFSFMHIPSFIINFIIIYNVKYIIIMINLLKVIIKKYENASYKP